MLGVRSVYVLGVAVKRVGLLCVGALVLTGCATQGAVSDGGPVTSSAPAVMGPGGYSFEAGGASGVVSLPGVPDAEVARAASLAGAGGLTFVTVSVDNRKGSAALLPQEVSVYTTDGRKVSYQSAEMFLKGLDTSKLPVEQDNAVIRTINAVNDPVSVGESRKVTMVGTEAVPAEFVRVTVTPDAKGSVVQAAKQ